MGDKLSSLLQQINALSPLPSDEEISEEQLEAFAGILGDLRLLRDDRCISPLMQSLGYGTGYGLYWEVLHFLETFDHSTLRAHVIANLQNTNPGTRMWCVLILGRMRNHNDLSLVLPLLTDQEELVRLHAVSAVVMVAGEDAKKHLSLLINDPSLEVRKAISKLLNA